MALSEEQAQLYHQTLELARKQIDELNGQIEQELSRAKERLLELKSAQSAARQLYGFACKMLGIENDIEAEEAGREASGAAVSDAEAAGE
jgi:hypothetical protein